MKTMLAVLTTSVLTAALLPQPARVHGQVNVSGVKEFVRVAPEETMPIPAGSYMLHPAGEIHYDGAMEEEVIVQLVAYGPSSTTRLSTEGNFAPSLPR